MALELKVVVIDPDRVIQVQLAIGKLQTKFGHCIDAQHHRVAETVEGVTAGHRRGVQLHDAAHVQRLGRGLCVQEKCVESAESLHTSSLDLVAAMNPRLSSEPDESLLRFLVYQQLTRS